MFRDYEMQGFLHCSFVMLFRCCFFILFFHYCSFSLLLCCYTLTLLLFHHIAVCPWLFHLVIHLWLFFSIAICLWLFPCIVVDLSLCCYWSIPKPMSPLHIPTIVMLLFFQPQSTMPNLIPIRFVIVVPLCYCCFIVVSCVWLVPPQTICFYK